MAAKNNARMQALCDEAVAVLHQVGGHVQMIDITRAMPSAQGKDEAAILRLDRQVYLALKADKRAVKKQARKATYTLSPAAKRALNKAAQQA